MKKLYLLVFMLLFLVSCESTMNDDPYLKESERVKLIEQAKTDTTKIFITIEDTHYVVEKDKVLYKTGAKKVDPGLIFLLVSIIMILLFVILTNL